MFEIMNHAWSSGLGLGPGQPHPPGGAAASAEMLLLSSPHQASFLAGSQDATNMLSSSLAGLGPGSFGGGGPLGASWVATSLGGASRATGLGSHLDLGSLGGSAHGGSLYHSSVLGDSPPGGPHYHAPSGGGSFHGTGLLAGSLRGGPARMPGGLQSYGAFPGPSPGSADLLQQALADAARPALSVEDLLRLGV
jgi:hypothetical protein